MRDEQETPNPELVLQMFATGLMSRETAIGFLGFAEDVAAEIQRIEGDLRL